ncbi:iron-sulfur cluster biosynthesis transcriptional regulator SufR [Merismopedia glauca]|uniref:Iron-sulfur cluster biosynthesis transcriptional regulator SufR n=1 Tax=Merismopedia glauca CCAP 1448/3 TaxID=1296344 RepID=A0A2T1BWZ4_9CYAN|nr:iron-sulfur cluster biosynthesis transcriptional regulator SufR [Merismopedia glauca]PSB00536.1 iron-sulfur cluster biosynthesis transcriptional regulator SufR [Merismopedia glauca CCAP 1448/3]
MAIAQPTSTKEDILQYLLKKDRSTAQELATSLNISPQAIRRHLKDLEVEELIGYESVTVGMGRPQHMYMLSEKGRDRFPNSYDRFAVSFLETLIKTLGYEQASTLLSQHWERKAQDYRDRLGNGSLSERLNNLVELRRQEGYMAELFPIDASKFMLTEHNCAIAHIANSFPGVCGHELEMFAATLSDCEIERTHWAIDGEHRCGYLIQSRAN